MATMFSFTSAKQSRCGRSRGEPNCAMGTSTSPLSRRIGTRISFFLLFFTETITAVELYTTQPKAEYLSVALCSSQHNIQSMSSTALPLRVCSKYLVFLWQCSCDG